MSLEPIAKGLNFVEDQYNNRPTVNTTVNTGVIYGGIKMLGAGIGAITNNNDISQMADIAAPLVAATYANKRLNDLANPRFKDWIKIGVTALAGYDLGNQIMDYQGHQYLLTGLKEHFGKFTAYTSKFTGVRDAGVTAAGLSGIICASITIKRHKRNLRNTPAQLSFDNFEQPQ